MDDSRNVVIHVAEPGAHDLQAFYYTQTAHLAPVCEWLSYQVTKRITVLTSWCFQTFRSAVNSMTPIGWNRRLWKVWTCLESTAVVGFVEFSMCHSGFCKSVWVLRDRMFCLAYLGMHPLLQCHQLARAPALQLCGLRSMLFLQRNNMMRIP